MTGGTIGAALPAGRGWPPWPAIAVLPALPTPGTAAVGPLTRGSSEGVTWRLRDFMSVVVSSETWPPTAGRSNDMKGRVGGGGGGKLHPGEVRRRGNGLDQAPWGACLTVFLGCIIIVISYKPSCGVPTVSSSK